MGLYLYFGFVLLLFIFGCCSDIDGIMCLFVLGFTLLFDWVLLFVVELGCGLLRVGGTVRGFRVILC